MSPIEELSKPKGHSSGDNNWTVLANNARVNKSWEALMELPPGSTTKCYEYLCMQPMQPIRGRVFPLKHKKYRERGAWEYEVTAGDRVFYVPRIEIRWCSFTMPENTRQRDKFLSHRSLYMAV